MSGDGVDDPEAVSLYPTRWPRLMFAAGSIATAAGAGWGLISTESSVFFGLMLAISATISGLLLIQVVSRRPLIQIGSGGIRIPRRGSLRGGLS